MDKQVHFRIIARALIIQDQKLLFVSNDGVYWYLPGGHVEAREPLPRCVAREVYEETGLEVRVGDLRYVKEFFDQDDQLHKLTLYFHAEVVQGSLNPQWVDRAGGVVQYHRFFSLAEVRATSELLPRFLSDGSWLAQRESQPKTSVYQGMVSMRGFEVLEHIVDPILS